MKHRWEIQPAKQDDQIKSICIRCGFIKKITQMKPFRFRNTTYERLDRKFRKAPTCDGIWPAEWRLPRHYSMFLDDNSSSSTANSSTYNNSSSSGSSGWFSDSDSSSSSSYGVPDSNSYDSYDHGADAGSGDAGGGNAGGGDVGGSGDVI